MAKQETDFFRPEMLIELANSKMPFGKYQGYLLCNLPEPYLVWFKKKGFPPGKLGIQLASLYEIKVNGLEYLLRPLIKK
ncbi:hypothetical protein GQF61_10560 [Sphingobacterium sp. DK4209]|uniref:DUF3820 family protein n=1 Tax=Sphingobacterium zhuxiongii TaxID=2662364 RepID=A0A5Q0QBY0_9SPHI|nr:MULTISPECIES: DUF3820 family protein [unclassified Sphingobacterium]MVZ66300.1 hypothetical protein [Sphingobacterium sp. DK4209]QGA25082.1 hypothetical protein GFH32_01530 [Sphingobacterium sp. dk4302]